MTRLLVLLMAQAAATAWLVGLAAPEVTVAMAEPATLADATAGVLTRLLLLVATPMASAWLLVITLVDVVLAFRGGDVRRVAPLWIRRVVDQALGTILLLGVMAGPATAVTPADLPMALSEVSPDFSEPGLRSLADLSQEAVEADSTGLSAVMATIPPGPWALPVPPLEAPVRPTDSAPGPTTAPVHPDTVDPAAEGAPGEGSPAADPAAPDTADEGAPDEADAGADPGVHVVAPGENLWVIARGHLLADGQPAPRDVEVHAYWMRLIHDNLSTLRSGDANLIHPGERLVLPSTAEAAQP